MMEYLKNQNVAEKLSKGLIYRKKDFTLLRKPSKKEIGTTLVTYVKSNQGDAPRKESGTLILSEHIIAKNENIIGYLNNNPIYNEWPIHQDTVIKNYGQEVLNSLTSSFLPYKKKATIQAIEITKDILALLSIEGDILEIKVSWSNKPMIAHLGDYITNAGYSISKEDMNAYEII